MNQTCKVCGEPAAGFHFGAFTCEGCKSFFGRSYNNLSSISECKNNGECTINKKNRTACKACRLRKCLLVGMSKSGSRYGRRSNWFKIHCLLQEQQQQAAAAAAAGNRKTPPPPSTMNILNHPSYASGLGYPRPPCTKEELMLLGFEDYPQTQKHSSASPSVSSPDSHNSDSSVEIGDRRQSMLRQTQAPSSRDQLPPQVPAFNKDLFLPLSFPGLMPPPGFLPPSHLMFPGYHPALYAQHQGLLKPAIDPSILMNTVHNLGNNNSRFALNHNSKSADELTKRYLDAVLKSQQRSPVIGGMKTDDEDMESEDVVVSMTPPRSPPSRTCSTASAGALRDLTVATTTAAAMFTASKARSVSATDASAQEIPIDLSMKASSCTSADDIRLFPLSGADSDISDDEEDVASEVDTSKQSSSAASVRSEHLPELCGNEGNGFAVKRITLGTTPLDLTTKI